MEQNLDTFYAFANSTDYKTGASDAGWTVIDGGTLPYALSSDYDYRLSGIMFEPLTVSDEFKFRIVTCDSNKATQAVVSQIFQIDTAAANIPTDNYQHVFSEPQPITFSSNANYIGVEVDLGDSDALATFSIAGYRIKKNYL